MTSNWYCLDCETGIDPREVGRHANAGHHIRGMLVPTASRPTELRRRSDRETAIRPVHGPGD
ncbi:hypothetical protein [Halosimplex sp. TS25]|uniref:hypothetical protein n=1 Tax=Halosimplex rarum TaxID=3396619 RepID=UPI0039E77024